MARPDITVAMGMVMAVGATTDGRVVYASFLKEKGPSGPFSILVPHCDMSRWSRFQEIRPLPWRSQNI
jgi:hypothetical protein